MANLREHTYCAQRIHSGICVILMKKPAKRIWGTQIKDDRCYRPLSPPLSARYEATMVHGARVPRVIRITQHTCTYAYTYAHTGIGTWGTKMAGVASTAAFALLATHLRERERARARACAREELERARARETERPTERERAAGSFVRCCCWEHTCI
jgi:hypothetical protein